MTRKRQPASGDGMKERVLTYLDKQQTTKSRWFTQTSIAVGIHAAQGDLKPVLQEMASEGWFHIRHDPSRADVLQYRLRRDGDQ